jgi:uncharacterized glyoxalase superfamily protein PhnB
MTKAPIPTMPHCVIIPVLEYTDVEKAIASLCSAFGFVVRWQAAGHRAQLSYGDGVIVVAKIDASDDAAATSSRQRLLVRVNDINTHFDRASRNGVTILKAPEDYFYGERQYTAMDIGGHLWTFSQTINAVAPEQWGATIP